MENILSACSQKRKGSEELAAHGKRKCIEEVGKDDTEHLHDTARAFLYCILDLLKVQCEKNVIQCRSSILEVLLNEDTLAESISKGLTEGFANFLVNNDSKLQDIGGDLSSKDRVVYLAQLKDSDDETYNRLYVGSTPGRSSSGHRRIAQHESPTFRNANPSRFYHAVDNKKSRSASYFILFTFCRDVSPELILIAKAMCVAIFRTMPDHKVWDGLLPHDWLPKVNPCGLNVSSPIQGNLNSTAFGIDALRNSGDPETEAYYKSVNARGQAAQAAAKRAKALKIAQEGGEIPLSWKKTANNTDRWMIRIGSLEADLTFPAQVAARFGLTKNQMLKVKYDIVDGQHPKKFITDALPTDDCWSLGILASGVSNKISGDIQVGDTFQHWLTMKNSGLGRKATKMANTIMDFVSGIPPDTEHTKKERYYRRRGEAGKKVISYT